MCTNIMSFTRGDFLFKGTVCKSWHDNVSCRKTSHFAIFASVSRVQEVMACNAHISGKVMFKRALECGANMCVLWEIEHRAYCGWDNECMILAVSLNRLDAVIFLREKGCMWNDQVVNTAIEKGHLDLLRHVLQEGCPIQSEVSEYEPSMFVALRAGSVDTVKLLVEFGCMFGVSSLVDAIDHTVSVELLRYLESEGLPLYEDLQTSMMPEQGVRFLLENGVGRDQLNTSKVEEAVYLENSRMTELLLEYNCPVSDVAVDFAILSWDFNLARLLMKLGCSPTTNAYRQLFMGTQLHYDAHRMMSETMGLDYIRHLDWLFSIGCRIAFTSFSAMQQHNDWSFIFEIRPDVARWFCDRIDDSSGLPHFASKLDG